MHRTFEEHRVSSAGLALSVREHSAAHPGKAHLVLVHGYPDQQDVWDPLVAELDHERLHVVTYDVRGAGASGVPAGRDGYRSELLVEDFVAVMRATVPDDEPVHLVGHDWGSVQLWDVVAAEATDQRLRGRIASFTSISGPSLDHVAHLSRHRRGRELRLLNQSLRSAYVYAFHVPVLPELLWTGAGALAGRAPAGHWGPELARNARNGLNLYRANVLPRMQRPRPLRTDVPVLVVQPRRDGFVTDVMLEDLDQACTDLTVVHVDAGHWLPRTHPRELAGLVLGHVQTH